MEVILLEKIRNLGNVGDKVKIKPGYGRNFLIPTGKAAAATKANLEAFESRRAELEKAAAEALVIAQSRAEALEKIKVTIYARQSDEGKLYGSIGTREIAKAVTAAGCEVSKAEVSLPAGSIREVGEFEVTMHLHPEVRRHIKINVLPEAE